MHKQKLVALCDTHTLHLLESAAGTWFDILHTRDAARVELMVQNEAATSVIVDHALCNGDAIAVLQAVRNARPGARRVLLTDHCNLGTIVQGIHSGVVERIIYKPVADFEVVAAVCPPELQRAARPAPAARAPMQHVRT